MSMEINIEKLNCTALRRGSTAAGSGGTGNSMEPQTRGDFYYCLCSFDFKSNPYDRYLLTEIEKKGIALSTMVNPGAANDSSLARSYRRICINAVAGVLAEYLWRTYLNLTRCSDNLVYSPAMDLKSEQIDLKTIEKQLTIEVRSSFPRNGIGFAICNPVHQFDIIGPYSNSYKPGEIQKDFYVRTLYPFDFNEFSSRLRRDNLKVYLTGGATWKMFSNPGIAFKKSFIPKDEISIDRLSLKSEYMVIPFSRALDTVEIFREIQEAEQR